MSDVDLEEERAASLQRRHLATDRGMAARIASELALEHKGEVTTYAIGEAIAKRAIGGWKSARIHRLIELIRAQLEERKSERERRQERLGFKRTAEERVTIGQWLDGEITKWEESLELKLAEQSPATISMLVRKLLDDGFRQSRLKGGRSAAWYNHIRAALQKRGWSTSETWSEIMGRDGPELEEEEEEPPALSTPDPRPEECEDPVQESPHTEPEEGEPMLDADPTDPALEKQTELKVAGPWGRMWVDFSENEVHVELNASVSRELADRLIAEVLREKLAFWSDE